MPAYKYTLKNKKPCGMLPLTIQTGPGRVGIPVKEDSKHNDRQKSLNGHFWIRRRIPATYSFPLSWKIIWKTWNTV